MSEVYKAHWYFDDSPDAWPMEVEFLGAHIYSIRIPVRNHDESVTKEEFVPKRIGKRVIVSNHNTDCATGHTECSLCHEAINPGASYCEHCGAELEG